MKTTLKTLTLIITGLVVGATIGQVVSNDKAYMINSKDLAKVLYGN